MDSTPALKSGAMAPLNVLPLAGIGEIVPGENLVETLSDAIRASGNGLEDGDVLVVTSKIVSKAQDRFVTLNSLQPSPEALRLAALTRKDPRLVELVLAESQAVVRAARDVLITRHRLGLVMANAGIDQSNLGPDGAGRALLLPVDPDAVAETLAAGLGEGFGSSPAVVISDSFGRPWRNGVVNVAIGSGGLPALVDRRGERDRDGRVLEMTQVAIADMIACAAGLVCGEGAEGMPAAIVRGIALCAPVRPARALIRPVEQDLFR